MSLWPDEDEKPSDLARLIDELDRGIGGNLRTAGEPSVWDEVAEVFDEF